MTVNRRTPTSWPAGPVRRSQSERRETTRQALLDAALDALGSGVSFDRLSLRRVTHSAGVSPSAFYRHFATMDELGLELVQVSVRTLRAMLREVREGGVAPDQVISRSVKILLAPVHERRRHFAFLALVRTSDNAVLRHTIRAEIRLFASELATDLARFPVLRDWSTDDLMMLSGLFVDVMIAAIEAMLEATAGAPANRPAGAAEAEISALTERRLRLIALAIPHWRSTTLRGGRAVAPRPTRHGPDERLRSADGATAGCHAR